MTTDFTKRVAKEIFDRRLTAFDIENDQVFTFMPIQTFITSMGADIKMTLSDVDEEYIATAGKEQEPSAEEYIDCFNALARAVVEDVAGLALPWWNGRIEELTRKAAEVVPGKTRIYKAYVADKEGNEDTLYIGTNFDAAKDVAISVDDEFTDDEKRRGIHAALAYGDVAAMDAEGLTEGEKEAVWSQIPVKTLVARAVWYGPAEF